MLKSQKKHPAIMALHSSLTILSVVGGSQPWLLGMLTRIPGASAGYQEFIEWCGGELQARKAVSVPLCNTSHNKHCPFWYMYSKRFLLLTLTRNIGI